MTKYSIVLLAFIISVSGCRATESESTSSQMSGNATIPEQGHVESDDVRQFILLHKNAT